MTFKKFILVSFLSATALSAAASETNKDYYVQFNSGAAYGQKPKGDFSQGTLDNSAIYGFAVGYKFHENFRADWSLDYRPGFKNSYMTSETVTDEEGKRTYITSSKVKVKSLVSMVNFYYDIVTIDKFTPYATFGLGLARNKTNNYTRTTNSDQSDPSSTVVYSKGTRTEFAWKIGLGSKYEINQDFDLDLRYQYADLGKFSTGGSASLEGEAYESTPKKIGKIKSHEILLGIAYKF